MKQLLIILIFSSNFCNSQIDTTSIFTEINNLTNDSLINDYWNKLHKSDQKILTFSQPKTQAENLIKCCYLIQKHGYPTMDKFGNLPAISASIIWEHNRCFDMDYYSFPIISELKKQNLDQGRYPDYFMQNLLVWFYGVEISYPEIYAQSIKKLENNSLENINIPKIVELANEFITYENTKKKKIIGNWNEIMYDKVQKIRIVELENGALYLDHNNHIYKLTKSVIDQKTYYHFTNKMDNTYFSILENGELMLSDENGKLLRTYKIAK